jgi:DNA polymerase-3 subunit delta'
MAPHVPEELSDTLLEDQPHARAVLGPVLTGAAAPSHAYLLYGPPGTGKRELVRALAASLLGAGARNPRTVAERVARGAHPDLTWVAPSGAAEMLVSDIEEPVVVAAMRTPFESTRRVFVIESVERMNDQSANRMLKTLEEPPAYVHLLLISDHLPDVLPTIASRCQHVRFDPLPAARIVERLTGAEPEAALGAEPGAENGTGHPVGERRAQACARLALGDARLAAWLAGEDGERLREQAEAFVRSAITAGTGSRPWEPLLERAREAAAGAGAQAGAAVELELELLPTRERKRHEREALDSRRRSERRASRQTLELSLRLAELWLRDVMCVCEGAPELIYAVDRHEQVLADADGRDCARVREALELLAGARLSLAVNVSEELALEALAYRLEGLLAA